MLISFELKNARATDQLVNIMLKDYIGKMMEVYIEDMLVKSKVKINHVAYLKDTFRTLRKYQMNLNPAKCVFGVESRNS